MEVFSLGCGRNCYSLLQFFENISLSNSCDQYYIKHWWFLRKWLKFFSYFSARVTFWSSEEGHYWASCCMDYWYMYIFFACFSSPFPSVIWFFALFVYNVMAEDLLNIRVSHFAFFVPAGSSRGLLVKTSLYYHIWVSSG